MAYRIRRVDYFSATVRDQPGEAFSLLSLLAGQGISLLAFTAVPVGPAHAHLTLFPEHGPRLLQAARQANLILDGPHPALLVHGDDELGALATIHQKLFEAGVNIVASSGVTDGQGTFGYVIYVRPGDLERAMNALEV
ncbi:MAG: hypothetical protein KJ066_21700 [Acidobacteria bacterium]|nr:hypothetical protein [Acidobacteriota bacterium]